VAVGPGVASGVCDNVGVGVGVEVAPGTVSVGVAVGGRQENAYLVPVGLVDQYKLTSNDVSLPEVLVIL
jgi:hypothetical protein